MRRLSLAVLLLLPTVSSGQWLNLNQKVAHLIYAKDVTGTSYTYCKLVGKNGDPFAAGNVGRGTIETSGSSTTVVESVTGSNPFTEVAVGDLLVIQIGSTVYRRAVTARASAASITVDAAIDLGTVGVSWTWYQQKCGTGAEDGWLDAGAAYQINVLYQIDTINATSIDTSLECRLGGMSAATIGTASKTTTGVTADVLMSGVWDECRVGLKLNTDTGAQKVTVLYGIQDMSN